MNMMKQSEVNVFKAEDFHHVFDRANSETASEIGNRILSERLVKWHATESIESAWKITKCQMSCDTHIIYGLDPQPIKEPVKKEITRKMLFEALCKHPIEDQVINDVAEELGL